MASRAHLGKRFGAQARFDDELRGFIYAFGGDSDPQKDTIDLLNDMTVEFIAKTTAEAAAVARTVGNPLNHESVLFTVRNEPLKRERINELLHSFDAIKKVRTANTSVLAGNQKQVTKPLPAATEKSEKNSTTGSTGTGSGKKERRPANKGEPKADGGETKPRKPKKPKDPSKAGEKGAGKAAGDGSKGAGSGVGGGQANEMDVVANNEPQQTEFMM